MSIKTLFLNIFFPLTCYGCGEVGSYLCDLCIKSKILVDSRDVCHVCKENTPESVLIHRKCYDCTFLDGVVVAAKYNKFLELLLVQFKYEFVTDLKNILVKLLIKKLVNFPFKLDDFVLTFVPLHKKRLLWRGYNQSEILAVEVGNGLGLNVENLLVRKVNSKTQVGLSREERVINLKEVFELKVLGKVQEKVIIIDDVMTTGTTLEECAKVLKENGVKKVFGLVVGRG